MSTNLTSSLQIAVPLYIAKFKKQPLEEIHRRLKEQSGVLPDLLGGKGEIMLFGDENKKGDAAEMFNQTAEAIALMSFLPGGVHVFGHWETIHPESEK